MKDEITIGNKRGQASKCYSCNELGHGIINCPLIHMAINKPTYLMISNSQIN